MCGHMVLVRKSSLTTSFGIQIVIYQNLLELEPSFGVKYQDLSFSDFDELLSSTVFSSAEHFY